VGDKITLGVRLGSLLVALGSFAACGGEKEYVYTRQTPAVGRISPTEFTVRLTLDRPAKTVTWMETARDREGEIGSEISTLNNCTFLDDQNWECEPLYSPVAPFQILTQVRMRDGQLFHRYWHENRVFTARRRR